MDDYFSPAKIEQMKKTLEKLKKDRPGVIAEMQLAATDGDFSENAPYQDAKHRLRRLNNRMLSITEALKTAVPTPQGADAQGRAQIGSVVEVEMDGEAKTFYLVGAQEADPARNRITGNSPIGSSLLGHKNGDAFSLRIAGKEKNIRILSIS